MPRVGKRERERKINEQINIYFSAIKIRTIMEVRLQKKGKKMIVYFLSSPTTSIYLREQIRRDSEKPDTAGFSQ